MTRFLPVLNVVTLALRRRLGPADEPPAPEPLDHPALRGLSPRELADLPLPRPAAGEARPDALGPDEPPPQETDDLRPAA